jgi:hypothetical protein
MYYDHIATCSSMQDKQMLRLLLEQLASLANHIANLYAAQVKVFDGLHADQQMVSIGDNIHSSTYLYIMIR